MHKLQLIKQNLHRYFQIMAERIKDADINNYSIVIAYYTLLAIFPLFILLGSGIKVVGINAQTIMTYVRYLIPETVYALIGPFIKDFLQNGSVSLVSITGILTLWAASRGINAVKRALNYSFGIKETQRYLTSRIVSMVLTIAFGIIIFVIFIAFSFGQLILDYIIPRFDLPLDWLETFMRLKTPTAFMGIALVLTALYYIIPNCRVHLRTIIPGSLLATTGWLILSQGFSLYIKYFAKSVMSYGTIGTFIVLMFWLNYSAWIIIFGAVIGASNEYYFYDGITMKTTSIKHIIQQQGQKVVGKHQDDE